MHESILSRMMRISKGTYYSGSWSSTACIFQISLHPRLELNPSSPGAGRPTHQPRASGITVYLAWLGLYIDFTHKLTINPLSLYKRLKEPMGGGGPKTPFFIAGKINPSLSCHIISNFDWGTRETNGNVLSLVLRFIVELVDFNTENLIKLELNETTV